MTTCECGCGRLARRRFLRGHNAKKSNRWRPEDRGYETPCWIWQLNKRPSGYGVVGVPGTLTTTTAHRLAYVETYGPIASELQVDHLCKQRDCVNPAHLEAVTPRENILRSDGPAAVNARKVRCIHGHDFTPENTYLTPDGRRDCRTCRREATRRRRQPSKEAA